MVKVSIITMNSAYNYGAQLQAYALKEAVTGLGCECNIIDRRRQLQKDVKLSPSLYDITAYMHKQKLTEGYRAFEDFDRNYHNLTTTNYKEHDTLMQNPPDSDVFITGSDQVWNPLGFDPAYFLDFVPLGRRRISYAASLGISEIPERQKECYYKLLSEFDSISVREEKAKELLAGLLKKDIEVHCDPVFLLGKERWMAIEKPVEGIRRPYILCYILYRPKWLNNVIRAVKRKTGKTIVLVDLSGWRNIYHDMYIRNAGPREFIWLINYADGLITSSFHGTAFASIFGKPFISIINPEKPARIQNILEKLDLTDHNLMEEQQEKTDFLLNNGVFVGRRIEKLKTEALSYLRQGTQI